MTKQIDVLLKHPEAALLQELQAALATPLRPSVSIAETIRAALYALRDRVEAERAGRR